MVFISRFIGAAAALAGVAHGLPRPDHPAEQAPTYGSSSYGAPAHAPAPVYAPKIETVLAPIHTAAPVMHTPVMHTPAPVHTPPAHVPAPQPPVVQPPVVHPPPVMPPAQHTTMASYGSGKSNWDNKAYDSCVQQCVATYGGPTAAYTPPPVGAPSPTQPAGGNGVTHTVVVAPSQGVLRYVPFMLNATVGDTVKFMWGANGHTVTKSSALTPCNKTGDAAFASGLKNQSFVFTQVVNDTNPVFFHCAAPNHCQRGMFGIVNPPAGFSAPTSVGNMMASLASADSGIAAYAAYTAQNTVGNAAAARWGSNVDMATIPEWAQSEFVKNVMYTRNVLAANPELLKEDGSVDMGSIQTTPLMLPKDLSELNNAGSSPAVSTAASTTSAAAAPVDTDVPDNTATSNSENLTGAAVLSSSSSKVVVSVVVALASFFML